MRVLFGLAAGAASASRGDLSGTFINMGVGGLGELLSQQDAEAQNQAQYEAAFQDYKKEAIKLEVDLRQQARREALEIDTLKFNQRLSLYELNDEKDRITHAFESPDGIVTIRSNGEVEHTLIDSPTNTMKNAILVMEFANMRDAFEANRSIEGLDPAFIGVAQKLGIDPEGPGKEALDAALLVSLDLAPGNDKKMVTEEILDQNPELAFALRDPSNSEALNELKTRVLYRLYAYYRTNPKLARRIHVSMSPAGFYSGEEL